MSVADLGWCFARYTHGDKCLTIVAPHDSSDGQYHPAASVAVYGEESIQALHDLCGEALAQIREVKR
jgi:hypothetical protein